MLAVTVQILLVVAFHLGHPHLTVAQSRAATSSSSFLSHLSFPLTPPLAPVPVNIHRLARLASRLHTGLPLVIAAVGGSNMAGNAIEPLRGGSGNGTLVDLVVEWMNEKFPVDQDVALQELQLQRRMRGEKEWPMGTPVECDYFNETTSIRHRAENRAVGGTRSSMASFCLDRLLPCATSRSPDLLLIEFSVNDYLPDDDTSSFDPAVNMERLVRQVLQNFSHTAVIFTHFAFAPFLAMNNAEPLYAKVASQYHVPEISFRRWSADFLYQREHYAPTEGWVQTPDSKLRLLPNRIPLPIPEYFAERGLNFRQALYADCYHMNDRGHQLMASLVNQQLLGYVEHLKASAWTSMVDPLLVFSDPVSSVLPVFLDRPVASLPPVLSPFLATADFASFHCSVLYSPYNPNAHAMTRTTAPAPWELLPRIFLVATKQIIVPAFQPDFWFIMSSYDTVQLVAIDSVFHHHPAARVHVISDQLAQDPSPLDVFTRSGCYIEVITAKLQNFVSGTPLDSNNLFPFNKHIAAWSLLWKFGGVYMEDNVMLVSPMSEFRNVITHNGENSMSLLAFDSHHPFLHILMLLTLQANRFDVSVYHQALRLYSDLMPTMLHNATYPSANSDEQLHVIQAPNFIHQAGQLTMCEFKDLWAHNCLATCLGVNK